MPQWPSVWKLAASTAGFSEYRIIIFFLLPKEVMDSERMLDKHLCHEHTENQQHECSDRPPLPKEENKKARIRLMPESSVFPLSPKNFFSFRFPKFSAIPGTYMLRRKTWAESVRVMDLGSAPSPNSCAGVWTFRSSECDCVGDGALREELELHEVIWVDPHPTRLVSL